MSFEFIDLTSSPSSSSHPDTALFVPQRIPSFASHTSQSCLSSGQRGATAPSRQSQTPRRPFFFRIILTFHLITIDVQDTQITRHLEQIEHIKTAIPARTIESLHDLIHQDLLDNMSESIRQLYNPQRHDIYRLATNIKGKSPMYLSPIVDTRQAVEDLLSKWFESRTTVGEKEYMVHLAIERTNTPDEEVIPVKEKVKVKKERKIKKEIKDEIKGERLPTSIS
ncbi:hypothetical protein AFLA70_840g000180 [Aspergillus flavus AF70]|nr:hypothetical protein AFLA70_840g000180 [Aspergillus flavus AF70]